MAKRGSNSQGLLAVAVIVAILLVFILKPVVQEITEQWKEDRYSISLGEDFDAAGASRDDLGISVVLAVDVSGSMGDSPASGGQAKFRQASAALLQVVGVLERLLAAGGGDLIVKVGVIRFSTEVETVFPLTVLDAAGLKSLKELVSDPLVFRPDGATSIGTAIEHGLRMLLDSGTLMRSLMVVTDGENTTGVTPSWVLSALYGNRNDATSPEIPVFTDSVLVSFIGFDIGRGYFDPLSRYGARVTSASDQAELAQALSGLLEADITKLEASDGF